MPGIDPSISLQAQPSVQLQNPMDTMGKVMQMKSLADQSYLEGLKRQQMTQDFNDNQAMRNAYANNTTVDADGNATLDRHGMMKDLAQNAPSLLPQQQMAFATQDFNAQKMQYEKLHQNLDMMGQLAGGVHDQASYEDFLQQGQKLGGNMSQFPQQYDPKFVANYQAQALSAKDQIATKIQQQEANTKQQQADQEGVKNKIELQKFNLENNRYQEGKQNDAFKDLMNHAESSRQLPDVKQAYSDRYNAQKVIDIVHSKDDPNKIDVNMVPVVASEVAKIAQGGAPQHEELSAISPQDANNILARAKQYLTSNPQAGEQGAFLKAYGDYAKLIQDNANKVINKNIGSVYNQYKDHLKPSDASNFKRDFIDGVPDDVISKGSGGGQSPGIHPDLAGKSIDELKAMRAQMVSGQQASVR